MGPAQLSTQRVDNFLGFEHLAKAQQVVPVFGAKAVSMIRAVEIASAGTPSGPPGLRGAALAQQVGDVMAFVFYSAAQGCFFVVVLQVDVGALAEQKVDDSDIRLDRCACQRGSPLSCFQCIVCNPIDIGAAFNQGLHGICMPVHDS